MVFSVNFSTLKFFEHYMKHLTVHLSHAPVIKLLAKITGNKANILRWSKATPSYTKVLVEYFLNVLVSDS